MGYTGCEEFALWFTVQQADDPPFRSALRELVEAETLDLEAVASLVERLQPRLGQLAREEFAELPRISSATILRSWLDSIELGLPFSLVSERPDGPIDYARRRCVNVAVEAHESGITVRLSHIPSRHPSWGSRLSPRMTIAQTGPSGSTGAAADAA